MRMRKKKNLVPRMDRCGAFLIRDPYDRQGHWRDLMPQAREVRLELGCGKGRFTAGTAAAEPDVLFIAVERVPDAMVVAMERCVNAGLTNVYFHRRQRRSSCPISLLPVRSAGSTSTSAIPGPATATPSAA